MKVIMMLCLFIPLSLHASNLIEGTYECTQGNNDSICNQIMKPYFFDEVLTGLKVTYSGYCEGMGSNGFGCEQGVCASGAQEIIILDERHYKWTHFGYDFHCIFELSDK